MVYCEEFYSFLSIKDNKICIPRLRNLGMIFNFGPSTVKRETLIGREKLVETPTNLNEVYKNFYKSYKWLFEDDPSNKS